MEKQLDRGCDERPFLVILKELQGQLVNVRVLGDWMFTGDLIRIEENKVFLDDVTVTSCGGLTLCSFDVPRVRIFVERITSVGQPAILSV